MEKRQARIFNFLVPGVGLEEFSTPDIVMTFTFLKICFVFQCDPNLEVFGVWINTLDPTLPRIALFSRRDIHKGEELTFDYMMTGIVKGNNIKVASLGVCSSVIERWEKMLPLPSSSQLIKKIYEAKERPGL
jgi:hypothetical protein